MFRMLVKARLLIFSVLILSLVGAVLMRSGERSFAQAKGIAANPPRVYLPLVAAASAGARPTPTSSPTTTPRPTITPTTTPNPCLPAPNASRARIASSSLNQVGQLGGAAQGIAVQGNYAYLGVGPNLWVIDVSNPAQPTLVGQSAQLRGAIQGVAINGAYVYATYIYGRSGGIAIVDVSNPQSPTVVGILDPLDGGVLPRGLAVSGQDLYVTGWVRVLQFDISNPADLVQTANDYAFLGFGREVSVANGYVYTTDDTSSSFYIFNAANYLEVANVQTPATTEGIAVVGNIAYIADSSGGLVLYDVSNPASARQVGAVSLPGLAQHVTVSGSYAYVADGSGGVSVVDITSPANPVVVGCASNLGTTSSLAIQNNRADLVGSMGLDVLDLSNPTSPRVLGAIRQTGGNAVAIKVSGTDAFVADQFAGLRAIDVSNPAAPREVGFVAEPGTMNHLAIEGNDAFLAAGSGGLRIVDISQPANLSEIGSYVPPNANAVGIAVSGSYAYVADATHGLEVVDVSNPAQPRQVGALSFSDQSADVAVSGNYAYVVGSSGLHIVDVSIPGSPRDIDDVSISAGFQRVLAYQTDIYCMNNSFVDVFDVSNPSNPQLASGLGLSIGEGAADVIVANNTAYIVAIPNAVGTMSPPPPAQVTQGAEAWLLSTPYGVAAANGYVYVADGEAGLVVMQLTSP